MDYDDSPKVSRNWLAEPDNKRMLPLNCEILHETDSYIVASDSLHEDGFCSSLGSISQPPPPTKCIQYTEPVQNSTGQSGELEPYTSPPCTEITDSCSEFSSIKSEFESGSSTFSLSTSTSSTETKVIMGPQQSAPKRRDRVRCKSCRRIGCSKQNPCCKYLNAHPKSFILNHNRSEMLPYS